MTLTVSGGIWRCQAPKGCERAQLGTPFDGPTQYDARRLKERIHCPDCGGTLIMYGGDSIARKEESDAS